MASQGARRPERKAQPPEWFDNLMSRYDRWSAKRAWQRWSAYTVLIGGSLALGHVVGLGLILAPYFSGCAALVMTETPKFGGVIYRRWQALGRRRPQAAKRIAAAATQGRKLMGLFAPAYFLTTYGSMGLTKLTGIAAIEYAGAVGALSLWAVFSVGASVMAYQTHQRSAAARAQRQAERAARRGEIELSGRSAKGPGKSEAQVKENERDLKSSSTRRKNIASRDATSRESKSEPTTPTKDRPQRPSKQNDGQGPMGL